MKIFQNNNNVIQKIFIIFIIGFLLRYLVNIYNIIDQFFLPFYIFTVNSYLPLDNFKQIDYNTNEFNYLQKSCNESEISDKSDISKYSNQNIDHTKTRFISGKFKVRIDSYFKEYIETNYKKLTDSDKLNIFNIYENNTLNNIFKKLKVVNPNIKSEFDLFVKSKLTATNNEILSKDRMLNNTINKKDLVEK
jgi:hypothetical protein